MHAKLGKDASSLPFCWSSLLHEWTSQKCHPGLFHQFQAALSLQPKAHDDELSKAKVFGQQPATFRKANCCVTTGIAVCKWVQAKCGGSQVLCGAENGSLLMWSGGLIKFVVRQSPKVPCHQGAITVVLVEHNKHRILTAGTDG